MKSPSSARRRAAPAVGGLILPQAGFRRRRLRLLLIWGFLSLICAFLDWSRVQGVGFSTFDSYFYEMKVKLSALRNTDLGGDARKHIVVAPITDNTFDPANGDRLKGNRPSREDYARALSSLKEAGARVVVFDVVFQEAHGDKADEKLVAAAQSPGAPTVWGCLVENEEVKPRFVEPFPRLFAASPREGHILSLQEATTGSIQQIATVYNIGGHLVPSLSVAAVLAAKGEKSSIQRTTKGWQIGPLSLPDVLNIQYLNDTGDKDNSSFPTVPFEKVVHGIAQKDPFYAHFFQDKIVIIGDKTKISNDFRPTPVGMLPGVEIQANAIASVLIAQNNSHPVVWDTPEWAPFLILSLLCGLTVLIAARFEPLRAAASIVALTVAYFLLEVEAFVDHGLMLHTAGPTIAILMAALLVFWERGVWEEREKTYVRGLLGRYVSPSVADFILRHPERCALGGVEVTATVLFADIRDFTALTESLPPRATLSLLNDYFQAMSDVVFAHDGMVDKFMGDAIMATFGAPVETGDHATHALSAAVQMLECIDELQARWQHEGLPPIRIGVGIGTGPMIVGNMGSETRTDFSAIGDAVNLPARLQDLNKGLGTTILLSAPTRAACVESVLPAWVSIGEARCVRVRGHASEEEVFPVRVEGVHTIATDEVFVENGTL